MRLLSCPGDCGAARAKDEEIAHLRGQVESLQNKLLALADLGAYRAVNGAPAGPAKPRPRPTVPLTPWANSAIGEGAIDIHAERRQLERDWKEAGGQPAAPASAEG